MEAKASSDALIDVSKEITSLRKTVSEQQAILDGQRQLIDQLAREFSIQGGGGGGGGGGAAASSANVWPPPIDVPADGVGVAALRQALMQPVRLACEKTHTSNALCHIMNFSICSY